MVNKYSFLLLLLITFISCTKENDIVEEEESIIEVPKAATKPNILLVIADDMGLDTCPGYSIGSEKPTMPTLESMINSGIRFNNIWSNPTCTPTRSTILTGKYGFRTNVIKVNDVISTSEISLQKYLETNLDNEYSQAVIGKWHLSSDVNHPTNMGIEYYAGFLSGVFKDYWKWNLIENEKTSSSNEYNTTKYTDLAINWIEEQTKPWFLWLAYNAPHDPFHLPPAELHSQGNLPTDQASIDVNPLPYYLAMLEAMDSEMGRLISSLSSEEKENTIIIFIGDNGTPNQVAQEYNSHRVKGSLYQGGINVPMIISGKGVERINDTEDALINLTDLYATIANIAGVEVSKINDSYNFNDLLLNSGESLRDFIYSEEGEDVENSSVAIRNSSHKYILFEDGTEALFDLKMDPLETKNLMHSRNLPLASTDDTMKNELIKKLEELKNKDL